MGMSDKAIEIENIVRDIDPEDSMVLEEILFGEDLSDAAIGEMGPWSPVSRAFAVHLGLVAWG